jgi:competence protein ComEA
MFFYQVGAVVLSVVLTASPVWATPVNVNTADAQTIADALHNVGLKKAQAIVAHRTKYGAITSLNDFDKIPGIGAKTIEKNKTDILFGELFHNHSSDFSSPIK